MTIAMRHVVKFPANVQGTKGIDVSRKNGTFTFKLDYEDLTAATSVASNVNVAFQDPFTGEMGVTSLSSALNSNSNIQAIANAETAANKLGYWNGASSYVLADFSAFGRAWIGVADAAAGRTALGVSATSDLATVATSGAYSDLTGKPTLGTAAALDTGTTAGKVVVLDGSGKLPAVDGSQLTGISSGGALIAANNLSDVDDADVARANLGAEAELGYTPVAIVSDKTALKALDPNKVQAAYLTEDNRDGVFVWRAGDFSAEVAVDLFEGRVIASPSVAATVGAWHRPRERTYFFTDFGMDPTGANNSTDALYCMFNYVKLQGGGALCDRPSGGLYRFDGLVPASDMDVRIIGSGRELTEFRCNNSTGIINFEDTGARPGNFDYARRLQIEGVTFVALNGTGGTSRGTAVQGRWPHPSPAAATPCAAIIDCNWRSETYDSNNDGAGYWGTCVLLHNAHATDIVNPTILQINNKVGYGIALDYDNDAAAYSVAVKGIRTQGLGTGVYVRGHVENLQFDVDEMAGNGTGFDLDANTSTIPGGRNPVVNIRNGHVNSQRRVISAVKYNVFNVNNCDLYKGVGFGDEVADLLHFEDCKYLLVNNCKLEVVAGLGAGFGVGQFYNVTKMRMSNCLVEGGDSGLIFSGASDEITIDADVRSNQNVAAGSGIYAPSGVTNGCFRGEVVGWARGIYNGASWDVTGARYRNNTVNI